MEGSKAEYGPGQIAAETLGRNKKVSADDAADHGAQDHAGDEIREPMNRHGDTDSDVKGIKDGKNSGPAVTGKRRQNRKSHGKSYGGV